jgi:hypothetical protein
MLHFPRPSPIPEIHHQDTKGAKPTQPPIWPTDHFQRRAAKTQRESSEASSDGEVPAVGRQPETAGLGNGPKTSFCPDFLAQRPALKERRPRDFSSSFSSWEGYASL